MHSFLTHQAPKIAHSILRRPEKACSAASRLVLKPEALPHAFWYHFQLPETKEALQIMANFFDENVKK